MTSRTAAPRQVRRPSRSQAAGRDHLSLRVWLRLFSCSTLVAARVSSALKREFGSSLARFDVLSQLYREPEGLRMGELSTRTLTTGGNITWLVGALEQDGYVTRSTASEDRRASRVSLTAAGRRHFALMAQAHERWIVEMFSALSAAEQRAMYEALGTAKQGMTSARIP
ncbi:MAG: MarR family transcriptional regulator [Gemmatimonadetes bacterium]|nr:MarR family transcriptional regulator [Gemmatimonadota bacterium]